MLSSSQTIKILFASPSSIGRWSIPSWINVSQLCLWWALASVKSKSWELTPWIDNQLLPPRSGYHWLQASLQLFLSFSRMCAVLIPKFRQKLFTIGFSSIDSWWWTERQSLSKSQPKIIWSRTKRAPQNERRSFRSGRAPIDRQSWWSLIYNDSLT